jgi:hypothetical protein
MQPEALSQSGTQHMLSGKPFCCILTSFTCEGFSACTVVRTWSATCGGSSSFGTTPYAATWGRAGVTEAC